MDILSEPASFVTVLRCLAGSAERAPDTVIELLAPDVGFTSPFAEYRGRGDVAHLFGKIARVLDRPRMIEIGRIGDDRLISLIARVDAAPIEGMVRERHDARGRLAGVTLYLRPYRTLGEAIRRMGAMLAEDPLPSAR
jgi:hypothetical protein